MDSTPRVSVIIPTYNRLPLLQDAVSSVLDQTCRTFELIIADDGSTDGTDRYCRELAAHTGARYLKCNHTGMPGAVRNRGGEAARGAYLAFLDSDDLWSPKKLEKQLVLMETSRMNTCRMHTCRFSHTRERWLRRGQDGTVREISQAGQKHRSRGDIFDDALKKCIIGPSTVMMERALFEELGGFREDLEIAEDYEFWLRATAAEEICYLDEPLTIKQAGHGDQLSEKYGHIEYFRLIGLKALVDSNWFPHHRRTAACRELARKCRIYAAGCRKRGRGEEALQYEEWGDQYQREAAGLESSP